MAKLLLDSEGSIEYIHSIDSLSDAIDFDFSNIKIQLN